MVNRPAHFNHYGSPRVMRARLTGREMSIAWLVVMVAFGWTAVRTTSAVAWVACGISILLPALAFMVAAHTPSRTYRGSVE